ncbi:MAG: phenylacetate-CoA oxygenase subunit PaaC [Bacteroidetes bacterium]|nr:phenylacetate-CoA oxygenase subunit PaaC [Bacteroidota bacterium]
MTQQEALFNYSLRLGDNALVLAQRLCEWCGHGPVLEEDIAMSNMGLDLIGQSRGFYSYAALVEGKDRTEDDLAFLRNEREFFNRCMVEQPNYDFAATMMRSFLYGCLSYLQFRALTKSIDNTIAGLAEKSLKEVTYHVRHSSDWVIRLGDGTDESHQKAQTALDELWHFTNELFEMDESDEVLIKAGIACDLAALRNEWNAMIDEVLLKATLIKPSESGYQSKGGMKGMHTEHLGHLLSEMQFLPRAYPDAKW